MSYEQLNESRERRAATYLLGESDASNSEYDKGYRGYLRAVTNGKATQRHLDHPSLFGEGARRAEARVERVMLLNPEGEIIAESTVSGNFGSFVSEFQGLMSRVQTNQNQRIERRVFEIPEEDEDEEDRRPGNGVGRSARRSLLRP